MKKNKSSHFIKKLAFINIVHKKRRTLLSVTAVALSTAIIFISLTLFMNIFQFSKSNDSDVVGNFHYAIPSDELLEISPRYEVDIDGNTGYLGNYQDKNISLHTIEQWQGYAFILEDGRLPDNHQEVVVPNDIGIKIGTTIEVPFGKANFDEVTTSLYGFIDNLSYEPTTTMSFEVVGLYQRHEANTENMYGWHLFYTIDMEVEDYVYYVKDKQVQLGDGFDHFMQTYQLDSTGSFSNGDCISIDVIYNYLQDTTLILLIFVLIIIICLVMSYISIRNVIIITDEERRKEIGLLKSVGAMPIDILVLLRIELIILGIIGAILGLGLGVIIAYYILSIFTQYILMTLTWSMILQPLTLIIAFVSGVCSIYFAGMKSYQGYSVSMAIDDLKVQSNTLEVDIKSHPLANKKFEYQMFLAYNKRMKPQTRNMLVSFVLLMITTVLLTSVAMSNQIYKNQYASTPNDFELTNFHPGGGYSDPQEEVANALYNLEQQGLLKTEEFLVQRSNLLTNYLIFKQEDLVEGGKWLSREEASDKDDPGAYYRENFEFWLFDREGTFINLSTCNEQTREEELIEYALIPMYPAVFDKYQLDGLKPYLVEGSLENLQRDEVVLIKDYWYGRENAFVNNLEVGDTVFYKEHLKDSKIGNSMTIKAIVQLPYNEIHDIETITDSKGNESIIDNGMKYEKVEMDNRYFPFDKHDLYLGFSLDAVEGSLVDERIQFQLKNPQTFMELQTTVEQVLLDLDVAGSYEYTNYAMMKESTRLTTFLLEALLYPLFLLLLLVSLINIYNVLSGNIHLKKNDLSMLKGIGMDDKQARKLFMYEYIESYFNASWLTALVFIPFVVLDYIFKFDSVFNFGKNIIGTIIFSVMFVGVGITLPLVLFGLRKVKDISPLDSKQQD